jgi:REP element-mobilizing transposase RayT
LLKYLNKYRSESIRLKGWDYRSGGAYFITICTKNREHFFGECQNGIMKLSTAGMIVQGCWFQIPYLNLHVELGAFVVMPNHIHGILILDDIDNTVEIDGSVEMFDSNISTTTTNNQKNQYFKNISPKSGSVSRIIQQYKTVCTKHIKQACPNLKFHWQSLFHDHIIRDETSFQRISNYIKQNPSKWTEDNFS